MQNMKLVYDLEHSGTSFVSDDVNDIVAELEALASSVGFDEKELVVVCVKYMSTDEFESLPEFDGF